MIIVLLHVALANAVGLRRIDGFQAVVKSVADIAQNQWVFYSGDYNGIFAYYLRAEDQTFSLGVVRSSKLLYVTLIDKRFGLHENVSSRADVLDALRKGCGCRYLLVERELPQGIVAERYLRDALRSEEFRLLRTFPVETPTAHHVDLYEFLGAIEQLDEYEVAFPELGKGIRYRIRPIQR